MDKQIHCYAHASGMCAALDRNTALLHTLQQIMQVLGPEPVCECSGCSWETGEALRLLREAGIEYQHHRTRRRIHEPDKERKGNATSKLDT